ncbi:hypothetical protein EDC14_10018 [Hydrogenispora ethanolica]|jgi:hypothetical protein|uniref:Uncharacterized protein n=1 Tax=Hydrogenispora ethanolica TaxID=1082276 RepID=A0A4R1SB74_HYDET|nr:hypothetical protein EDC14_10018 [Hydrogenispora ethanolica]
MSLIFIIHRDIPNRKGVDARILKTVPHPQSKKN